MQLYLMDHCKIFFAFLILLSLDPTNSKVVHGHVSLPYCNRTPYPQICNSFIMATNTQPITSQETNLVDFASFRDISIKITLDHAREAHRVISSMDFSSLDERARMAWEDCLELYEDTVHHLNQTVTLPSSKSHPTTLDDIQTYLSASVANYETCKNGFVDLKLASHLESFTFPLIFTNFSKLLTNTLSINRASSSVLSSSTRVIGKRGGGGSQKLLNIGSPPWVSSGDRKLLELSTTTTKVDLVVAKDGSGDYMTISEAIAASKKLRNGTERFVIRVKKGVYMENVVITNKMENLMLIGDGIDSTIVTGNRNVHDGFTTFRSATFAVSGKGFIAKGITFENTAGPKKHQAVALRSSSDFSIFYGCTFKGYQDTLYVHSKRQFYKHCHIYGTVDFIFGDASAVIQTSNIYVRRPLTNQVNTITAQGRSDPNENTGIVIHGCLIEAAPDLRVVQGSSRTFLGRPWRNYSRTVVMRSAIDGLVDPAGWAPWSGVFALETLYYGEYMNIGPGADTGRRVRWPGYHMISSPLEARNFTVRNFLGGDTWITATGVPFTSGL